MLNKINKFAEKNGYDGAKETGFTWNGYSVYDPYFSGSGVAFTGYPYVILVKDEKIRMSTKEESLKILAERYPNEETEED
jgi:hypothetical protein